MNEQKREENGREIDARAARLLSMASDAIDAGAYEQAQHYADEAIALDDTLSPAWELRAAAATGKQGSAVLRMEEAVNAWLTAERHCPPEEACALRERIAERFAALFFSELKTPASQFSAVPTADGLQRLLQIFSTGLQLLNTLAVQADVTFSCGPLFNRIARLFTDAAADGFNAAAADFGPAHNNMQLWQWEKYTEAGDLSLRLLEKAVHCCRDNALGKRICDLYIGTAQAVRDSCSWKYDAENPQNTAFILDLAFTDEAKRIRTEDIRTFRTLRGYFEADQVTRLCRDLEQSRAEADAARAKESYWHEHAPEKADLERELQALRLAAQTAESDMGTLPVSAEIARIKNELSALQEKRSALGFGKRSQKRELQQAARDLLGQLPPLEQKEAEEKKALSWTVKKANARAAEIRRIFSAPRGSLPAPAGTFTFTGANGEPPSPQALCDHLDSILPAPYRTAGVSPADARFLPQPLTQYEICLQCGIRKETADLAKQGTDIRLFFFAGSQEKPLCAALLQAPAAVGADEADLHDFAYIGSCLLLSLLPDVSQPEAEKTILSLRHGNGETVFARGALCCSFLCIEKTDAEGGAHTDDLLLFKMIPNAGYEEK